MCWTWKECDPSIKECIVIERSMLQQKSIYVVPKCVADIRQNIFPSFWRTNTSFWTTRAWFQLWANSLTRVAVKNQNYHQVSRDFHEAVPPPLCQTPPCLEQNNIHERFVLNTMPLLLLLVYCHDFDTKISCVWCKLEGPWKLSVPRSWAVSRWLELAVHRFDRSLWTAQTALPSSSCVGPSDWPQFGALRRSCATSRSRMHSYKPRPPIVQQCEKQAWEFDSQADVEHSHTSRDCALVARGLLRNQSILRSFSRDHKDWVLSPRSGCTDLCAAWTMIWCSGPTIGGILVVPWAAPICPWALADNPWNGPPNLLPLPRRIWPWPPHDSKRNGSARNKKDSIRFKIGSQLIWQEANFVVS